MTRSNINIDQYLNISDHDYTQLHQASKKHSSNNMIKATIIKIDPKYVVVDAGLKEEGIIPILEFKEYNKPLTLQVGDKVTVHRAASLDGNSTYFSYTRARKEAAWPALEEANQTKQIFNAIIVSYIKGKYEVELEDDNLNIPAILPERQLEAYVNEPKSLFGQKIRVRIMKLDRNQGIVTVSQKLASGQEEPTGESIHGTVISVDEDKATLECNGQTYILRSKDYLWEHVPNLTKRLKIDQVLRVKVLNKTDEGTYVSHRLLFSDPWLQGVEQAGIQAGTSLYGTVVSSEYENTIFNLDTNPPLQGTLPQSGLEINSQHVVKVKSINKKNNIILLELV